LQNFCRALLILSTLIASWLGMQAVHELGHVLGAWLTGGEVERVVLHPLTISRTDLAYNPRPLVVVWAGPVFGCSLPLLLWTLAWAVRLPGAFVLRFFAGFCLIANGLYIGVGSFARIGDCGDMLRHGSSTWQLWLFGLLTTPVGVWLWNGQGKQFGLGPAAERVHPQAAVAVALIALGLVAVGITIGGN
jgi:hypothetical protein